MPTANTPKVNAQMVQSHYSYGQFLYVTKFIQLGQVSLGQGGLGQVGLGQVGLGYYDTTLGQVRLGQDIYGHIMWLGPYKFCYV